MKLFLERRHIQLFGPLLTFPLAKLSFLPLKCDHLSLRSFHEALSRRFDQLSGHATYPVIIPEPPYPSDGTRERFMTTKLRFGDAIERSPTNSVVLPSANELQFREPNWYKQVTKSPKPAKKLRESIFEIRRSRRAAIC